MFFVCFFLFHFNCIYFSLLFILCLFCLCMYALLYMCFFVMLFYLFCVCVFYFSIFQCPYCLHLTCLFLLACLWCTCMFIIVINLRFGVHTFLPQKVNCWWNPQLVLLKTNFFTLLSILHNVSESHQWCSGNFSLVGTLTWHYGHIHYHYWGGGGGRVPE